MTKSIGEIVAEIQKSQSTPMVDPITQALAKSTFSQPGSATSGINYYDLEIGAKFLVPDLTPLRNEIPRVSGKGGIQANWRAITGINTTGLRIGVSGGNRSGVIAISTQDYSAAYKGIGLEDNVDFEADYSARGFDDVRAQAALRLLQSTMIGEEQVILGGNNSISLGVTATPTLSAATTGGSLATAGAFSVICVALSFDGIINGSIAGGIQASITRANADASADTFGGGAAQKSANATVSVTGATGSVTATVTAKQGAFGYAWFWAPTAGSEVLGAITTINSVSITSLATGTQTAASLPSADWSQNNLVYDGLLTIASKNLGGYYSAQATGSAGTGTPLTADGAGGVIEIDAALKWFWDYLRLSPQTIWVNSQEALNISRKIVAGSTNAAQRFVFSAVQDAIGGGIMVRTYLNRFSMGGASTIDIRVHPNMPAGTILFDTMQLPYPLSGVASVRQIRTRQEYYQIEWPLRSRKYEYGVYADEVLQHYFPPSLGIITNIGNG